MERRMIQIPYKSEEEAKAQKIRDKIGMYKIRHGKRTRFDALYEIIVAAEEAEAKK